MADTTVATDVHQSLDVELDFGAQIPFDLVLGTDHLTDSGSLVIGPVLYLDIAIDPSLIEDLGSAATTDPEDVSKYNLDND